MDVPVDRERLLKIALLHDLPEHMLGDIHAPASKLLGEDVKEAAELRILEQLFRGLPGGNEYLALWREFSERSSLEGRIVRAVDKLEMFTQAYQYECAGNRMLDDFWGWPGNMRDFEFEEVRELYDELMALRHARDAGQPDDEE
jgi:putative hydrolase of HD superfamily